jgi:hypothetical protein
MEIWTGLEFYSPDILEHMKTVANTIWESGRVARDYIKNPQTVLLVMQKGRDLGIPPLVALDHLRQFRDGGPWACSFDLAKALVTAAGGSIIIKKEDDFGAQVEVTREGRPPHVETVTMEDFERSGQANKDTCKKYPRQMLRASATRRALMIVWPDKFAGVIPADDMELEQDDVSIDPADVTADDARPRKSRAKKEKPEQVQPPAQVAAEVVDTPTEDLSVADTGKEATSSAEIDTPPAEEAPISDEPPSPTPSVSETTQMSTSTPLAPPQKSGFTWDVTMDRMIPEVPFDYVQKSHRMQLVRAIKEVGFETKVLAEVRKKWEAGWYKGRCTNSLDSIKTALTECAHEQDVSK